MQQGSTHYNVWLDCDPGLDDTIAIIIAAKTQSINLLGVSTSAGNTSIQNTTRNALDVLYNLQRSDVVVVRGSDKLVKGQPHLAAHMHGGNGLGGVQIPKSDKKPVTQNSFQYIRDCIMKCNGKVTWANTGALTNLWFLLTQHPQVKSKIDKIVLMGGAIGQGNITPAAQFNIFFDPQAYKEVLKIKQNIPLVMIPLQVTHQVQCLQKTFQFLKNRNHNPFANAIYQMLRSYQVMYKISGQDFDYPPIHDPTVINYILHPDHFQFKKALIDVDVDKTSYGRTNCYFYFPQDPKKSLQTIDIVATKMNKISHFWDMFQEIIAKMFKQNSQ